MPIKTIYISNEYFQGFNKIINTSQFTSFKELSAYMKEQLIAYLQLGNLQLLVEKAKEMEFHTHEFTFYNELINSKVDNIFLCHH